MLIGICKSLDLDILIFICNSHFIIIIIKIDIFLTYTNKYDYL